MTGRTTHRMLPPDEIRKRFADKPEVADWILAVRSELEDEFEEVDTLAKFAERVKERQSKCTKSLRAIRRMASEQLTTAPGPSSKLAGLVLRYVVEPERYEEVRAKFAQLYSAARKGEVAPFAAPAPQGAQPAPVLAEPVEATTAELRELVPQLRQMINDCDRREVALRAEQAVELNARNAELAARTVEVAALRELVEELKAQRSPTIPGPRRHPTEYAAYRLLGALDQPAVYAPTSAQQSTEVDLEAYWAALGSRGPFSSHEVNHRFGAIADELVRQGVGGQVPDALEPVSVIPANNSTDGGAVHYQHAAPDVDSGGQRTYAAERSAPAPKIKIPREWTSAGPLWFYALMLAAVIALSVVYIAPLLLPSPPPSSDDYPLISIIHDPYPVGQMFCK